MNANDPFMIRLREQLESAREATRSRKLAWIVEQCRFALTDVNGRVSVYLFGSWATGRFDGASDVDLLVIAPEREVADGVQRRFMEFADDVVAYTDMEWVEKLRAEDSFVVHVSRERRLLVEKGGKNA